MKICITIIFYNVIILMDTFIHINVTRMLDNVVLERVKLDSQMLKSRSRQRTCYTFRSFEQKRKKKRERERERERGYIIHGVRETVA